MKIAKTLTNHERWRVKLWAAALVYRAAEENERADLPIPEYAIGGPMEAELEQLIRDYLRVIAGRVRR